MKRLKNMVLTLGMAGSLLLGVATSRPAVALEDQAVMARLTSIPVFTLVDNKGNPIVASLQNDQQEQQPVLLFFLNHQDALEQLAAYQKAKPAEGKTAGVRLLSMREVLESIAKIKDTSKLVYSIEPNATQLQAAVTLLKDNGQLVVKDGKLVTQQGQNFVPDIPLFFPTLPGEDGKVRFLPLTVQKQVDGKTTTEAFIPFYLSKNDLDRDLQRLIKDDSKEKVKVQVLMFNTFLTQLKNAKSEEDVPYRIIPADESSKFVNSLLQQAAQNKGTTAAPQTN